MLSSGHGFDRLCYNLFSKSVKFVDERYIHNHVEGCLL